MSSRKAKKPWLSMEIKKPIVPAMGLALNIPDGEKEVLKEVPAKVDGVEVGVAQIYTDGSVSVIIDDDAPQWAKDKIKAEADKIGYKVGTDEDGRMHGSS